MTEKQAEEAVRKNLEDYLHRMGHFPDNAGRYHCISPDHKDGNPSMTIEKNGKYAKCWSHPQPRDTFNIFDAISMLEGIRSPHAQKKHAFKLYHIEIDEATPEKAVVSKTDKHAKSHAAQPQLIAQPDQAPPELPVENASLPSALSRDPAMQPEEQILSQIPHVDSSPITEPVELVDSINQEVSIEPSSPVVEVETTPPVELSTINEPELQVPKPSEAPKVIEVPEPIEIPEVIEVPEPIEVPEVIEVPEPIEIPEPFEVTETFEVPEVIEVPEPIEIPEVIEVPEPIEIPEVIEVPEPIEESASTFEDVLPTTLEPEIEVPDPIAAQESIAVPEPIAVQTPIAVQAPIETPELIAVQEPIVVADSIEVKEVNESDVMTNANEDIKLAAESHAESRESIRYESQVCMADYVSEVLASDQKASLRLTLQPATATGFGELDKLLDGGLFPGLYLCCSRPGEGKTSFALQIADALSAQGVDVLLISMDMSRMELAAKSISRLSLLLDHTIARNQAKTARQVMDELRRMTGEEWAQSSLSQAMQAYQQASANLFVLEAATALSPTDILRFIELHTSNRHNRPVVILDSLQYVKSAETGQSDTALADTAVRALMQISRTVSTPIFALSSVIRDNYACDVVLGLQMEPAAGTLAAPHQVNLKVLKNRHGLVDGQLSFNYYAAFSFYEIKADKSRS